METTRLHFIHSNAKRKKKDINHRQCNYLCSREPNGGKGDVEILEQRLPSFRLSVLVL
jgi:hypothetical protein